MAIVHCIETELYFVKLHNQLAFKFKFKTILKQSKTWAANMHMYVCVCWPPTTNPGSKLRIWFVMDFALCVSECMYNIVVLDVTCSGFERQSEDENDFFFLWLQSSISY